MAFKWDESNGVSNGPTALHLCTDPGDLGVSKYYSGSTCLFGRSRRAESKINRDLANLNAPRRSAKYMSVPLDVGHLPSWQSQRFAFVARSQKAQRLYACNDFHSPKKTTNQVRIREPFFRVNLHKLDSSCAVSRFFAQSAWPPCLNRISCNDVGNANSGGDRPWRREIQTRHTHRRQCKKRLPH